MSVDPRDFIDREASSDCCGAPIMEGGMCSECHEHCEESEPEEQISMVRKNQVVKCVDGKKYVAGQEHPLPTGAVIVADRPHGDGDYSYCCAFNWCRCSQ